MAPGDYTRVAGNLRTLLARVNGGISHGIGFPEWNEVAKALEQGAVTIEALAEAVAHLMEPRTAEYAVVSEPSAASFVASINRLATEGYLLIGFSADSHAMTAVMERRES